MQKSLAELGKQPHEVVCISGIGCSSNFPGYLSTYGMHTLHGRALAVATGVKFANHDLTVLAAGGDGDGYGIGGNHFAHTARRNVDITYLVMNNQIYGLTTGQVSPASLIGMKTKSTPFGNLERPVNAVTTAIMNGATFVARGFSGHGKHLVSLISQAIEHKGFSIIDVFSPCVTFNQDNTYDFFRERIKKLEDEEHDYVERQSPPARRRCCRGTRRSTPASTTRTIETPALNDQEPVLEGRPRAHAEPGPDERAGRSHHQAHDVARRDHRQRPSPRPGRPATARGGGS